jgi:hypothetical protein
LSSKAFEATRKKPTIRVFTFLDDFGGNQGDGLSAGQMGVRTGGGGPLGSYYLGKLAFVEFVTLVDFYWFGRGFRCLGIFSIFGIFGILRGL